MDGGQTTGWTEVQAEDVGDALVAGLAAGGVDHLFFTSGSEIGFFQEATAKARARGHNNPIRLITVPHEHASLNAALGFAAVSGRPAVTAAHVDCGTMHYGGAVHTAARSGLPVVITAGFPADGLCRDHEGRPRRRRASVDAGDLRPERDRSKLRQVGPPPDLAGQPRDDREPGGPGHRGASPAVRSI